MGESTLIFFSARLASFSATSVYSTVALLFRFFNLTFDRIIYHERKCSKNPNRTIECEKCLSEYNPNKEHDCISILIEKNDSLNKKLKDLENKFGHYSYIFNTLM